MARGQPVRFPTSLGKPGATWVEQVGRKPWVAQHLEAPWTSQTKHAEPGLPSQQSAWHLSPRDSQARPAMGALITLAADTTRGRLDERRST